MSCEISPYALRTNYEEKPLGIGAENPVFGWKLCSEKRGAVQTAWRIVVSDCRREIESFFGRVWDSGKIMSSESLCIRCGGNLSPATRYYWRVMVWDGSGTASAWSDAEWFETGLTEPLCWEGCFITGKKPQPRLEGARWLCNPRRDAGKAQFYRILRLPEEVEIFQAWFDGDGDGQYTVAVNGSIVAKSNLAWGQRADTPFCRIDFADKLRPGENLIACAVENSGGGAFIGAFRILLADGEQISVFTDESWLCADGEVFDKTAGIPLSAVPAASVGEFGCAPWGSPVRRGPAPLFRKTFFMQTLPESARLYFCGLGYSRLTINGRRVGENHLEPAYTQFSKRVYYVTYDVKDFLRPGENCIGVELGRGYYACGRDWIGSGEWLDVPKLLLQLNINFCGGRELSVYTDTSWLTDDGPTVDDSIWYGEQYDANRFRPGWAEPGFDCAGWERAEKAAPPQGKLESFIEPAIKTVASYPCRLMGEVKKGVYLYDAGKMTAGWCRIMLDGRKNKRVKITYGERLVNIDAKTGLGVIDVWKEGHDGQFWQTPQQYIYICAGGRESWEPAFSYNGFRYVQAEGLEEPPALEVQEIHNAVRHTGHFRCSNELFNRIHQMAANSLLNNFHSIPTDTPMHEKRGWTGDAHITADSASNNFDMRNFYAKWVRDIADSQSPEGIISHTCPGPMQYAPTPAWMSAFLIIPWSLYQVYGDKATLLKHYPAFKKYVDYEIGRLNDFTSSDQYYADWHCPEGARGPEGATLFATAFVYRACALLAETACVLGHPGDSQYYAAVAGKIKNKINTDFFDAGTDVYHTQIEAGYRQSSNILPLAFGITPPWAAKKVADNLAYDVTVTHKGHLDTGAFSLKYLAPLLSEFEHHDAAFAFADKRDFPSWGFWLENGETACLEGWRLGVRSRDHHYLGTIDEWFYAYLAGILRLEPGFKKIRIKPFIDGLEWAEAEMDTAVGKIASRWSRKNGQFRLDIKIPANASAEVYVPAKAGGISEGGRPAAEAEGVTFKGEENGFCHYYVGSGNYSFAAKTE